MKGSRLCRQVIHSWPSQGAFVHKLLSNGLGKVWEPGLVERLCYSKKNPDVLSTDRDYWFLWKWWWDCCLTRRGRMNYLCTNGNSLFLENTPRIQAMVPIAAWSWVGNIPTNHLFSCSAVNWAMTEQAQVRGEQLLWALEELCSHSPLCSVSSMYIPGFLT